MANDSSTGGIIVPTNSSPVPLDGQSLNHFVQPALVSLTGLASNFVIPRDQAEPPNIPQAGDAWCSFGYDYVDADKFPYINHQNGFDQLQHHELIKVDCDFFDLGTNGLASYYARLLRDNLAIPQNREWLIAQSMNLAYVSNIQVLPVLFKQRWQYRCRISIYLRQNVVRDYPILDLATAEVTVTVAGITINISTSV